MASDLGPPTELPGLAPATEEVLDTVSVPEALAPIFLKAQEYVRRYFSRRLEDPAHSTISISGERYILVRAASMSVEFFELVQSLYRDRGDEEARTVARNLLFDLAHAIGKADARAFHRRMEVTDPIERLSAGPVHFSFSGWAFVRISPASVPTPDEDFFLVYDHPFSFEADSWLRQGRRADFPVCVMNGGYSSGWCEESFGLPLVATEVECLAKGDPHCRFLMAHPSKIESRLAEFFAGKPRPIRSAEAAAITVPEFFQRKRMEDALRDSESRFRTVFEGAAIGIAIVDFSGRILQSNQAIQGMLGYSAAELQAASVAQITHPDDLPLDRQLFAELAEGKRQQYSLEKRYLRKDGREVWGRLTASAVRSGGLATNFAIGMVEDITQQKQAAEALRRSEKLAAAGRLAATLAHEINNPLEGVTNLLYLLESDPSLDPAALRYVTAAQQELDRVAHIARQTLAFYREPTSPVELKLSDLCDSVIDVYARKIERQRVSIERRYDCEGRVRGFLGEVRQVVSNLLVNAIDAAAGGRVVVHISPHRSLRRPGSTGIRLVVADTGRGIPPECRARIFEPFFTTKGEKGTGLGLWTSFAIAQKHGGRIAFRSSVAPARSGTCFSFFLPER